MTVTSNNACTPGTATATLIVERQCLRHTAGPSKAICQNGTANSKWSKVQPNGTILWRHITEQVLLQQDQPPFTPTYTAAAGDAGNTITLNHDGIQCSMYSCNSNLFGNVYRQCLRHQQEGVKTICQNGTATGKSGASCNQMEQYCGHITEQVLIYSRINHPEPTIYSSSRRGREHSPLTHDCHQQ